VRKPQNWPGCRLCASLARQLNDLHHFTTTCDVDAPSAYPGSSLPCRCAKTETLIDLANCNFYGDDQTFDRYRLFLPCELCLSLLGRKVNVLDSRSQVCPAHSLVPMLACCFFFPLSFGVRVVVLVSF
jgi:hypothetical protein